MKFQKQIKSLIATLLLFNLVNAQDTTEKEELVLIPGPVAGEYKKNDLNETYDDSSIEIDCDGTTCTSSSDEVLIEEGKVVISNAGTYIFGGELNGQLNIAATKEDLIHLVLRNATITSDFGPAIYGEKCKKLVITTEGQNTVTDSTNYPEDSASVEEAEADEAAEKAETEETENKVSKAPNACIFVKNNLTFNGKGTLDVNANFADAIRSKKNLKLVSGKINVVSVGNAIKAKDSVAIKDAEINIDAGQSGIRVTKDTDPEEGIVVIEGGKLVIKAVKDAVHAETHLTVSGGYIEVIECEEGLEAQMVDITGGDIIVNASNDGINASLIGAVNEDWFAGGWGGFGGNSTDGAQGGFGGWGGFGGNAQAGNDGAQGGFGGWGGFGGNAQAGNDAPAGNAPAGNAQGGFGGFNFGGNAQAGDAQAGNAQGGFGGFNFGGNAQAGDAPAGNAQGGFGGFNFGGNGQGEFQLEIPTDEAEYIGEDVNIDPEEDSYSECDDNDEECTAEIQTEIVENPFAGNDQGGFNGFGGGFGGSFGGGFGNFSLSDFSSFSKDYSNEGKVYINITGGRIDVRVESNDLDGIDANGSLYIGGDAEVYVSSVYGAAFGHMASIDSDGSKTIDVGVTSLITATGRFGGFGSDDSKSGSGGEKTVDDILAMNPNLTEEEAEEIVEKIKQFNSSNSTMSFGGFGGSSGVYDEPDSKHCLQPYVSITFDEVQEEGTPITILDSNGDTLIEYTPRALFAIVFYTSPKIVLGETYTVVAGDVVQTAIAQIDEPENIPNKVEE